MLKKIRILPTTALLASAFIINATPALGVTVQVSDNGSESDNTANLSINRTVDIFQTNNANVNNDVSANADTGNNQANDNTGGDVSIDTGNANTEVGLNNAVNKNHLSLNCCDNLNAQVKIDGNGSDSNNDVNLSLNNNLNIVDEKFLNIDNDFYVDSNTGDNEANDNTDGDVRIRTGNANALVMVDNKGNENVIIIGGLRPEKEAPKDDDDDEDKEEENGLPKAPAVLGAAQLPSTGYNYPFGLIIGGSLGLVATGLYLRKKAGEMEDLSV